MKTAGIVIVTIGAVFLTSWIVTTVATAVVERMAGGENVSDYGFVMSKDAFNAPCIEGALSTGATREASEFYCSCIYDMGVQEYGAKEWTSQIYAMEDSGTYTPQMNSYINACIEETAPQLL